MTAALEVHAIDKVAADYYSQQSAMSDPGHHRALFAELQNDVRSPARIIHGLGIYDVVAKDFYGCDLSEERRREIHIRFIEKRLDRIMALEDRPLSAARPPDKQPLRGCPRGRDRTQAQFDHRPAQVGSGAVNGDQMFQRKSLGGQQRFAASPEAKLV